MPTSVVKPEITISQRTFATMRAAAGSSGSSSSRDGLVMSEAHQIVVAGEEAGSRLDRMLAARIEELSRSRLKALILDGDVAIDGRTIRDPEYRVNAGESVAVRVPAPAPAK